MQACAKGKLDLHCFDGKQHKAEFTFLLLVRRDDRYRLPLPCQHGAVKMSRCYFHSSHLYNNVDMTG